MNSTCQSSILKFEWNLWLKLILMASVQLLLISTVYTQNVEIQGGLKVKELNQNDTAVYVLIQNQDTTIGKRAVSSLLEVQGTEPGQIKYWNGSEWVLLPIGETGQVLTVSDSLIPQWKTPQKIGKPYIIIQGDISNEEAALKIQEDFGNTTQFVWVKNTKSLTFLDLSMVTSLIELRIRNNLHLQEIVLDSLKEVYDVIDVSENNALTNFSLDALTVFEGYNFSIYLNNSLSEISMNNYTSNWSYLEILGNSSLTSILLPNLTHNYNTIYVANNDNITNLNFSALSVNNASINIQNNNELQSIQFPNLQLSYILDISFNHSLTSAQLPELNNVSNLLHFSENDSIVSIILPELVTIKNVSINNNTLLDSIIFSSLDSVYGNISLTNNPELFHLNLNNLTSVGTNLSFENNLTIQNINLPQLESIGGSFFCNSNTVLTNISFPLLSSFQGSWFFSTSNALTSNVINSLLAKFVALGNTPLQNIHLDSQNPPAPPTGQGIIDKNTLIAAGKTVITD